MTKIHNKRGVPLGRKQAVMASRMGAKVAMVACLGQENLGDRSLENLANYGIDCASVRRTPEAATGVAQLCVEDSGCVSWLVYPSLTTNNRSGERLN